MLQATPAVVCRSCGGRSCRNDRGRFKQHENVAGYACGRLAQLQWQVLYAVSRTLMKPDDLVYKDADCVVLDAQILGTTLELGFHHAQKKTKYSAPDLFAQNRGDRVWSMSVSTITLNFRGELPPPGPSCGKPQLRGV
ncbi:uncharacterized protein LOC121047987 [Ixodes scapularis]|uniref:uncharacterized protein LOC121047987 n=1 Tax=Ixodes scapularis TaxID=6945 RepID=UPI001AD7D6BB|nr:uncharacterized protein LOC121047987 [Ixodes scapularis]